MRNLGRPPKWDRRRKQPRHGFGPSRIDRRFPPPGVKDVASYGWTTYKRGVTHGGGARRGASLQQPQRSTLIGRSPSPLWSRLCPGIRIGHGLARIAQILWGKAPWGGGSARPPPRMARRGATREGEEVEGATPGFLPLVRHRAGGGGAPLWSHHLPFPREGAPSTVIPGGKAVRPARKAGRKGSRYQRSASTT